ncbi:winged helix-turn-helix transcriptional regulator [Halorubrum ejinorense]|uniref:Winged helix-turn-helix transcriptional regulator n=2 Tax=Halorubrum ejinorense TaxID=425309 RepID=A0AAV3SS18_9EURY
MSNSNQFDMGSSEDPSEATAPRVLDNRRDATRYRVLVEIAARQPAVSQEEIADVIGVTSQAVSDYVRDLIDGGFVEKRGRGRYEVTKEGVDWIITRTDALSEFVSRVSDDVLGSVDVDAAVAVGTVAEGDEVGLEMRDGTLHAVPGGGSATAVVVTGGEAGEAVGVTDFEGVVEYNPGVVTVVPVPAVTEGDPPPHDTIREHAAGAELVAVGGTEAYALATRADVRPDVRFGSAAGVSQAALRGLDVLLLVSTDELSRHTTRLREDGVRYEVRDSFER